MNVYMEKIHFIKQLQNLNLIDRGLEEKWQEEKRLIYYKKYYNPGIPS